jgi:hypothetical protein
MTTISEDPTWDDISHYANHSERGWLLLEHADDLLLPEFWQGVADAWADCDRQSLTKTDWRYLWTDVWVGDEDRWAHVMNDEERAQFEQLPERVAVYRGVWMTELKDGQYWGNEISGMSWTLDRDLAHWFAGRYGEQGCVFGGTVLRRRILALLQERDESEVVVLPKFVYGRERQPFDSEARERVVTRRRDH